jgi:hypothetical protein
MGTAAKATYREPWNKGKIVGQKAPFKVKDIWALRVRLQMAHPATRPCPSTANVKGSREPNLDP